MTNRNRPVPPTRLASRRWRAHVNLIVTIVAVGVSLALFSVFLSTRQHDLVEEATPDVASQLQAIPTRAPEPTGTATPRAGDIAYPPGSLPALLALAPDQLDDDQSGLPVEVTYADIERSVAGVNATPGDIHPEEFRELLRPLELPEVLETRGLSDQWREVYGFDIRQVDQVLAIGHAPNQILIMPGRYDGQKLNETWARNGYQAVEVEETTVWSLVPGDQIDLSAPASRPALGMLNNVVLLDNGTLIATARQSCMAQALRAVSGADAPLLDHDRLQEAVDWQSSASAVSVVVADGSVLQQPALSGARPDGVASQVADATPAVVERPLPEVDLVLFGLLAPESGADTMSIVITLIYEDVPDDIERLPHEMERRVRADDAWSDRYDLTSIEVVGDDESMIEVRFTPRDDGQVGMQLVQDRDMEPFTWSTGD